MDPSSVFYVDPVLHHGRPEDDSGRSELERKAYDCLDRLGIRYDRVDHDPAATIADCEGVDRILGVRMCKNIFLCNRQKTSFYLLLLPGEKQFVTKDFAAALGIARTSFASHEDMERLLGIRPGAVTVLSLMNDVDRMVRLVIDREVLSAPSIGCHPLVNTSSVRIRTEDLMNVFLPAVRHDATVIDL